jgi:hypothetical protein
LSEPTPLPGRADIDEIRDLIKRRSEAGYDGTWLHNETIESMLTECGLYRLKHDASWRRQQDAVEAKRRTRGQ